MFIIPWSWTNLILFLTSAVALRHYTLESTMGYSSTKLGSFLDLVSRFMRWPSSATLSETQETFFKFSKLFKFYFESGILLSALQGPCVYNCRVDLSAAGICSSGIFVAAHEPFYLGGPPWQWHVRHAQSQLSVLCFRNPNIYFCESLPPYGT